MIRSSEEGSVAAPAAAQPAHIPAVPDLAAMRAQFMADFVGGRIGQHHNTFQHRERVLRQLTTQARIRGH